MDIKPLVLIVDDTVSNLQVLSDFLKEEGFEIAFATSGEMALETLSYIHPDIILLDMMMPGMDGLETCKQIKAIESCHNVPVIFMSALSEVSDKVQALKSGAVDYITKPIQCQEVLARIKTHLKLKAAHDQIWQLNAELEERVQHRTAQLAIANQQLVYEAAERQQALNNLEKSEDQFRRTFENAPIGMALISDQGEFFKVNSALCETLGYAENELLNKPWKSFIYFEDLPQFLEIEEQLLSQQVTELKLEIRALSKSGSLVHGILQVAAAFKGEQDSMYLIAQLMDITQRKQVEAQLHYTACHDPLTRLPNRYLLHSRLETALRRVREKREYQFAVLFLDIDRFKLVNDTLGHQAGDQLLISIAYRLEAIVRVSDTVARLGGDEFVILLDPTRSPQDALAIAERITEAFKAPFHLAGQELFVSTSIGIALGADHYQQGADLLRDADIAMYRAKSTSELGHYQIFDPSMYAKVSGRLHLENELHFALERQEFQLCYQPIMCLKTQQLQGFEALLRWHNTKRGIVSPTEFIPIAEETGLIVPIGEWVLQTACQQLQAWRVQYPQLADLKICVNLSIRQLRDQQFLSMLDRTLETTGLSPSALQLELTESQLMDNAQDLQQLLQQLRDRQVELSIDDFGTGYSSLSYLHQFPVSHIKVDRSFIWRIGEQGENRAIVQAIVTLAQQLGMATIAEGIEKPHQLHHLQVLGCESAQGYLFAKPLSQDDATVFLQESISGIAALSQ